MTDATARTVANAVLASAALAAAYVVITTPPLRRLASQATRAWLGGATMPVFLVRTARQAWLESARTT